MKSIKQLNEQLSKFLNETQMERTPQERVQDYIDGTSNESDLASIIVPDLDKFTDVELLDIFNQVSDKLVGSDTSIYPSGWDDEEYGSYPAKLALALSKSKDAENISEIYNIYYANHDLSKEAIKY